MGEGFIWGWGSDDRDRDGGDGRGEGTGWDTVIGKGRARGMVIGGGVGNDPP
jgi:hypothetical protein